jgi:hypothetical protein
MIGHTPTLVGLLDNINAQYDLIDTIPNEQTVNHFLGIPNPANTDRRKVVGIMFGRDGRDMRSANRNMLYAPLPLISRSVANPLTLLERQAYFLRKEVLVSGTMYEVYYGRTIDIQTPLSTERYLSYASPSANHLTAPLNLLPLDTDWTDIQASEAVIKMSTSYFIDFTVTDMESMEEACLLLGEPAPVIRELGAISGKVYQVSPGITEVTKAICINHASIYPSLTPPGIEFQLGIINGVKL